MSGRQESRQQDGHTQTRSYQLISLFGGRELQLFTGLRMKFGELFIDLIEHHLSKSSDLVFIFGHFFR